MPVYSNETSDGRHREGWTFFLGWCVTHTSVHNIMAENIVSVLSSTGIWRKMQSSLWKRGETKCVYVFACLCVSVGFPHISGTSSLPEESDGMCEFDKTTTRSFPKLNHSCAYQALFKLLLSLHCCHRQTSTWVSPQVCSGGMEQTKYSVASSQHSIHSLSIPIIQWDIDSIVFVCCDCYPRVKHLILSATGATKTPDGAQGPREPLCRPQSPCLAVDHLPHPSAGNPHSVNKQTNKQTNT